MVLDCFCGSGSTLLSAIRNERHWIGIDASEQSMKVVKKQLKEQFKKAVSSLTSDHEKALQNLKKENIIEKIQKSVVSQKINLKHDVCENIADNILNNEYIIKKKIKLTKK